MTRRDEFLALAERVDTEVPSKELDRAVEIALCGMLANQSHPPRRDPTAAAFALRHRAACLL